MATQNEKSAQTGGMKKFILASIGVSVLGLLFGFFMAAVLFQTDASPSGEKAGASKDLPAEGGTPSTAETPAAENAAGEANTEVKGPFTVVRLQPIVTNLADTTDVWVRLEGGMLFDSTSEEDPDVLAARIAQHVLAYLRTLKLSDLQGKGAVNAIVQDLNEITTTLSGGQAQGVLISGLVFE